MNQTGYGCVNPITVTGGNTINIASTSNAYGRKFVSATEPTGVCDGDVWYDPSGTDAGAFSAGTTLLFYQASAPTGWTKITTHDNKAMRVVSGTGGGSGGTTNFTSVFTSRGVPLPEHAHGGNTGTVSADHYHVFPGDDQLVFANGVAGWSALTNGSFAYDAVSTNEGGGQLWRTSGISENHTHAFTTNNSGTAGAAMDFAVQYIDVIICSKN